MAVRALRAVTSAHRAAAGQTEAVAVRASATSRTTVRTAAVVVPRAVAAADAASTNSFSSSNVSDISRERLAADAVLQVRHAGRVERPDLLELQVRADALE